MTNKVYCLLKAQKSGVFDLQIIICRLNWGQMHRYEPIFRDISCIFTAICGHNLQQFFNFIVFSHDYTRPFIYSEIIIAYVIKIV